MEKEHAFLFQCRSKKMSMSKSISTADIVLIEDNAGDADLTMRALKKKNLHYNVIHFEEGAEALDAIFQHLNDEKEISSQQFPHLIFLDLKLAGLSGKEVLKALKENEKTRRIPVVVLTSSNQENDVTQCYNYGANAYIVKPLDLDEYIHSVSEAANFWMKINYVPDGFS